MPARRRRRTLLTLSEVSRRTGISMPTLQKYKREHPDRIPSQGEGRRRRYPIEALRVFEELKEEGLRRRGRGGRAARSGPTSGATSAPQDGLLSLAEIERRTGISYPTLLRYVRLHGDEIPHRGEGRRRRYEPAAVEVFRRLRAQSRRGRRKSEASTAGGKPTRIAERLRELEKAQRALERQVAALEKRLSRPIRVTVRR